VGKTTTIAKLAAQYKLQRNTSVALLTIDTYRIAAVDQLRTYADIIDVPFSAVLTAKELSQQIARLSDHSLIFIDTTGRSPNDQLRLAELRSFQQALGTHQTQLVLAATTAYPQMISAIEKFSALGIDQLLLTKLDEVISLSPILNVFASLASGRMNASLVPISYVTAGQDVPDDISVASSRDLAARIMGEHCD
jgi:flagellar biosynthesis protein FlhF